MIGAAGDRVGLTLHGVGPDGGDFRLQGMRLQRVSQHRAIVVMPDVRDRQQSRPGEVVTLTTRYDMSPVKAGTRATVHHDGGTADAVVVRGYGNRVSVAWMP